MTTREIIAEGSQRAMMLDKQKKMEIPPIPTIEIASTLPAGQLLGLLLAIAIPSIFTSLIKYILSRAPKDVQVVARDLLVAEAKLNNLRSDKANLSRNFVKISKAERHVIFLTKKKGDEEEARLAHAAKVSKYASYAEMAVSGALIVLTYNKHLGTISHPPLDSIKRNAYLKGLVFPAHTFLQMIPSFFAKELDLFEGYGGALGMFAIWYAVNKSVKRIFNVMSW